MGVNHADVLPLFSALIKLSATSLLLPAGEVTDCERIILIFGAFLMASGKAFLTVNGDAGPNSAHAAPPRCMVCRSLLYQPVAIKLAFENVVGGDRRRTKTKDSFPR